MAETLVFFNPLLILYKYAYIYKQNIVYLIYINEIILHISLTFHTPYLRDQFLEICMYLCVFVCVYIGMKEFILFRGNPGARLWGNLESGTSPRELTRVRSLR